MSEFDVPLHSAIQWLASCPASVNTLAFSVHSIRTTALFSFLLLWTPKSISLFSTHLQMPVSSYFSSLQYFACALLAAFCALCHLSVWSGFSLEIHLAFLWLVNIVCIFQYLIPASYTPLILWVSLFPFLSYLLEYFNLIQALSFLKIYIIQFIL